MFIRWRGGSRHDGRRFDIQGCRGSFTQTRCFSRRYRCVDTPVPKSSPMGTGTTSFYPLKSKADASRGLFGFIQESGVPGWLISDGALEQRTRHWQDVVRDYQIRQTLTEPYSPWQNKAESSIRAIKREIRRFMQSEGI
jgi:hypothetical protein